MSSRNENVKLTISAKDKASGILGGIQKQIIGIGAAYLTWKGVTNIVGGIIKVGIEHEKVWTALSASLKRHNLVVDESISAIKKFSDEMQTLSGISDEVIATATQRFIDYGQDAKGAMDTVRVAMDLAAGSGQDFMAAVDLLAKASVGYTATLSRYGIIIDESIPKSEKFAAAIELINDRFGGAAKAIQNTTDVQMKLFNQRLGDLGENIFKAFGPFLTGTLQLLGTQVKDLTSALSSGTKDVSNAQAIMSQRTSEVTGKLSELNKAFREGRVSLEEFAIKYADTMSLMGGQTAITFSQLEEQDLKLAHIFDVALRKLDERLATGAISWDEFERRVRAATGKVAHDLNTDVIDPYEKMDRALQKAINTIKAFSKEVMDKTLIPKPVPDEYWEDFERDVIEASESMHKELDAKDKKWLEKYIEHLGVKLQVETDILNSISDLHQQAYDEEEALVNESNVRWQELSGKIEAIWSNTISDISAQLAEGRVDVAQIWGQMARDFRGLFIETILKELSKVFIVKLIALFGSIFDTAANDRMAMEQGIHFAQFFKRGVFSELSGYAFPARLSNSLIPAMVSNSRGISSYTGPQVTVNVNAPITSDQFKDFVIHDMVPTIQNATKLKQTRITLDPFVQTGVRSGIVN